MAEISFVFSPGDGFPNCHTRQKKGVPISITGSEEDHSAIISKMTRDMHRQQSYRPPFSVPGIKQERGFKYGSLNGRSCLWVIIEYLFLVLLTRAMEPP